MAAKGSHSTIDDVARECIAVRTRMLNRVVTRLYDDALRPLGLKVSQMNILVAAAKMGTPQPADVCRRLHLDVSTLSRNVERMRARGWLEVVAQRDGRARRVHALGDAALAAARFGERRPPPQLHAQRAVARQRAGGRQDQVAHPRQAGERLRVRPHRHADGAAHHTDEQIALVARQVRPFDALTALRGYDQLIGDVTGEQFQTLIANHTEKSPAKSNA